MTISHVYKKITEVMQTIQNINLYEIGTGSTRSVNQKTINKAYRQLDDLKAEIEREVIKNKQKEANKDA